MIHDLRSGEGINNFKNANIFSFWSANFFTKFNINGLPEKISKHYDVKITVGQVPKMLGGHPVIDHLGFQKNEEKCLINIKKVGKFYIESGGSITVERNSKSVSEDTLRLFLLGSCMGVILQQRGILALHASGLVKNERCILFIGPSGVGKSTAVNYFSGLGYSMIGDDVIPLHINKEGFQVIPSYPWSKLWKETILELEIHNKKIHGKVKSGIDKYNIKLEENFHEKPRTPKFAIRLDWQNHLEPTFKKVDKKIAFNIYKQNIYREYLLKNGGEQKLLIKTAFFLAKNLPLFHFNRPKTEKTIQAHLDRLNRFINDVEI